MSALNPDNILGASPESFFTDWVSFVSAVASAAKHRVNIQIDVIFFIILSLLFIGVGIPAH